MCRLYHTEIPALDVEDIYVPRVIAYQLRLAP